jgi:hypothetical protein
VRRDEHVQGLRRHGRHGHVPGQQSVRRDLSLRGLHRSLRGRDVLQRDVREGGPVRARLRAREPLRDEVRSGEHVRVLTRPGGRQVVGGLTRMATGPTDRGSIAWHPVDDFFVRARRMTRHGSCVRRWRLVTWAQGRNHRVEIAPEPLRSRRRCGRRVLGLRGQPGHRR